MKSIEMRTGGPLVLMTAMALAGCGASRPVPTATPAVSASVQSEFAQAVAALRAQHWNDAENRLQALARAQPQLSGVHLNLALLYARTDRPKLADAQFQQALAANADNLAARDQYGIWLRTQGRFTEAEKVYLQTLQRHPERADTHLDLGILYDLYLGKEAQALQQYEQYLTLRRAQLAAAAAPAIAAKASPSADGTAQHAAAAGAAGKAPEQADLQRVERWVTELKRRLQRTG